VHFLNKKRVPEHLIISLFLLQESMPHRHISKVVEILLIGFGVFVLAVFILATALHYYHQWKRSR